MEEVDERLRLTRPKQRVLSIQSHVVHGYAGNKCAVFPLQLHGFEVDSLNSVQFSTHTGYSSGLHGSCLNSADLADLYKGLEASDVADYSHVLTGYCGDVGFLRGIVDIVQKLKAKYPHLIYHCDPVLGDDGHYYVPKELMPVYRDEVLAVADVLTPNAFELGEITGLPVTNEAECLRAIDALHAKSTASYIVVTSGIETDGDARLLRCYASIRCVATAAADDEQRAATALYRFDIPRIRGTYVGSGDVFAALLLVWLADTRGDLRVAAERTVLSLQRLLQATADKAYSTTSGDAEPSAKARELSLIECRYHLLTPSGSVACTRLDSPADASST